MVIRVLNHKHKMSLKAAGVKGYTFQCTLDPCKRTITLSKWDFWHWLRNYPGSLHG